MKFLYVDESGSSAEGDIFVMAGLMIDAYKLRKHTENLDSNITMFLSKYPNKKTPKELKTKALINGKGHWGGVCPGVRKEFLRSICRITVECSAIYAISISFDCFEEKKTAFPINSHWLATSMYISSLVQKKMKKIPNNKGLTVLIFDDNKREMPKLSEQLYKKNPWFDGLYKSSGRSQTTAEERFDQIINTAFSINSEHSSFIQAADAVSYIYRRNLELGSGCHEEYSGEKRFYDDLVSILDEKREKIGRVQTCDCVSFYRDIKHRLWEL